MELRTKYAILLVILTLFVLALRLAVTFQVEAPSYESYATLIQTREIAGTGTPRYHDQYSYQGREYEFQPLYHYVMTPFTMLDERLALKLLPNLFLVLLVPLVYLLCHSLTSHRGASLIAALFAAFSPALFTTGLNDATSLSLALPLLAATLLCLLDLERRPLRAFLLLALLTLVTPLVWLLLAGLALYLLILGAERLKPTAALLETSLFGVLLAAWYTLITYKNSLHDYGFALLTQSLPATVRAASFQDLTLLTMIYVVGVIPLILGSFALYRAAFEERSRKLFLVASLLLATLLGGLLKLLPLRLCLILLSLLFVILSASSLAALFRYWRKMKFRLAAPAVTLLLLLFLLTSVLPAVVAGIDPGRAPSQDEVAATRWLAATGAEGVILAAPKSGFLINVEAQRPYVADETYLLIPDPDRVLGDIDRIYTTNSQIEAVGLTQRYGVTHILLGPVEHAKYKELGDLGHDRRCFPISYKNPRVIILSVNCTLEARR